MGADAFDALTTLSLDQMEQDPARVEQGIGIATAVVAYVKADTIEYEGHFDDIAALPFRGTDYVSRELRNEARG